MINRPTRMTKTSETAIDHILTNTIFCVLKTDLERKSNNEFILQRDAG